ncbi:hypothetical protein JYT87_01745 [Nitrospira defluvii]|nr:hypothetical protein [Nitrospira defluvii]
MDTKGLENKIKQLKTKIKEIGPDPITTRDLRKQLKRAQRRDRSLKARAAMIKTKGEKKNDKAA